MQTAIIAIVAMLLIAAQCAFAQPMSGNYTVGGTSPDFATFQDAADAVKSNGVSGPVFLNIRPGTYTRDGGATTLFVLDSIIAGVSPTNQITFQPDAASGGNVDNVILQADFNTSSNPKVVAFVRTDYTTLSNLTFKDADSMDTPVFAFLDASFDQWNLSIEGLEVDGCKFIGTPYFIGSFGTDLAIFSSTNLASASFTHNQFYGIFRAITNRASLSGRAGTFVVEDNEFYQGTGDAFTFAIQLNPIQASVRRNIIDLAGGGGVKSGIEVLNSMSAVIERNFINNRDSSGGAGGIGNFITGIWVANPGGFVTDSILIANNVVITIPTFSLATCMKVETPNTKVLYNTLIHGGGPDFNNIALFSIGANCTVLNNIILANVGYVAFDQGIAGQSQNLVSDYNIIFNSNPPFFGGLVRRDGVVYANLENYQAATGLDTNSASKTILFTDEFHLEPCTAQDPDLHGIPIPGITIDYDGDVRSSTEPIIGADESSEIAAQDLFGDPFRITADGAFSPGVGLLVNIVANSLAVPSYNNFTVTLYDYTDPRSYQVRDVLPTLFRPVVARIANMNDDAIADIVIACDADTSVVIFYFDISAVVSTLPTTPHRIRSIEVADVNGDQRRDIIATQDDGFVSNTGNVFVYLRNDDAFGFSPFMVDDGTATFLDLLVTDLTNDGFPDIAIIHSVEQKASIYLNLGLDGGNWQGFGAEQEYNIRENGTNQDSNIGEGDFDGDGDTDLLVTHATDSLGFLMNSGNGAFTYQQISSPHIPRVLTTMDYDDDGDPDLITADISLGTNGFTLFANNGSGQFTVKQQCFLPFLSGIPQSIISSHLDFDGMPDLLITTVDTVFVLFNLGGVVPSVQANPAPEVPRSFSLLQNYPNPFNPSTTVNYQLPIDNYVTLKVYDLLGREIATLDEGYKKAGKYAAIWDGRNSSGAKVSSGMYFYRMEAKLPNGSDAFVSTHKILLIK